MTERSALSVLYRDSRVRLAALVGGRPGLDEVPVPATPGWSVHDVVAHLTGVAQDLAGGWAPTGGPTEEWTAGHVERGRGRPTDVLLVEWARVAPVVERILDSRTTWPVVIDAGSHEHDVRGALGDTGARDTGLVRVAGHLLLRSLQVPAPLVVTTEDKEVRVGPDAGEGGDAAGGEESGAAGPVRLRTTAFEAFRWRLGRRSRAQLAAMDWTGDPEPFLDHLCVFGPARADLVE